MDRDHIDIPNNGRDHIDKSNWCIYDVDTYEIVYSRYTTIPVIEDYYIEHYDMDQYGLSLVDTIEALNS